jgi:hypothetical protein
VTAGFDEIESLPPQLGTRESRDLIHGIAISGENPSEESPETILQAWNVEIARRIATMEAGDAPWISSEEVFEKLDAIVESSR